MRGRSGKRLQRGVVSLLIAFFLASCVALYLLAEAAVATRTALQRADAARAAYLADAGRRIADWYRGNATTLDAAAGQVPDEAAMLRAAGVTPKWGVRAAVGPLLDGPDGRYRRIALWLPTKPGGGLPAGNDGAFDETSATHRVVVDGRLIEGELRARTLETMRRFARALESRASARMLQDSDHRVDVNHFRPRDPACVASDDEIPCLDGYVDATRIDWGRLVGVAPGELHTAWGGPIQVSNRTDASVDRPPFSFALLAKTPWGGTIRLAAIQALE